MDINPFYGFLTAFRLVVRGNHVYGMTRVPQGCGQVVGTKWAASFRRIEELVKNEHLHMQSKK